MLSILAFFVFLTATTALVRTLSKLQVEINSIFLCKISGASNTTYKAAVVEYSPNLNLTLAPIERNLANVNAYAALIEDIKQELDIIIFPESTITAGNSENRTIYLQIATEVPDSNQNANPCNSKTYPEFFEELSCTAARFNTYLVVNLIERAVCSQDSQTDQELCSEDDWNMYNTNVVFDRNGTVIARYRKFHLFGEFAMNITSKSDTTSFETDFGITFGTFTCFDIIFEEPAFALLREGVKHFIFPTMWFSQLPFLTALQTQNMWAKATNAVLLAAGANVASIGSGGSGIYLGKQGPLVLDIISHGGSRVYVQEIPKNIDDVEINQEFDEDLETTDRLGAEMDKFYLKLDRWITSYTSFLIEDNIEDTICYEDFCCNFNITISNTIVGSDNFYRYRIFVYRGGRIFSGSVNAGIDVCSIVFCQDSTVESCAIRYPMYSTIEWKTTFESVDISANYSISNQRVQFPNTLLSSIYPLSSSNYNFTSYSIDDGIVQKRLTLNKPQQRLMTFGIYGRDFSQDGDLE